ncbi:MAG TPA: hypothetical protein VME66_03275 [Candidatus Acidoferrales bacterium]|nr:hypothetical protein [Candidatus Acidoferrales bacterium]
MIPEFTDDGLLPPGIHQATDWSEIADTFGGNTRRDALLAGLRLMLEDLRRAGCREVFLDGSFVTDKELPGDFDLTYEYDQIDYGVIHPALLDVTPPRIQQKARYGGEALPNVVCETGQVFADFFQNDKASGGRKGIVSIDLTSISL